MAITSHGKFKNMVKNFNNYKLNLSFLIQSKFLMQEKFLKEWKIHIFLVAYLQIET